MLHGNVLLHDWRVSDVSFYTTELPQYVLIEAMDRARPGGRARGRGDDLHAARAAGSAAGQGERPGRPGAARALLAAGLMLAPQLSATGIVLLSPDHTGTAVPLLVTWLLIDRPGRRWYHPGAGRPAVPVDDGGGHGRAADRHHPAGVVWRWAGLRRADQERAPGRPLVRARPGRGGRGGRRRRLVRAARDRRPGRVPGVAGRGGHGPRPAAARGLGDPAGLPRAVRRECLRFSYFGAARWSRSSSWRCTWPGRSWWPAPSAWPSRGSSASAS